MSIEDFSKLILDFFGEDNARQSISDRQIRSDFNLQVSIPVATYFLELLKEKFDAVALIFAHFTTDIVSDYHKKITELLKPNGMVILEGFSKNHLEFQKNNPKAGGPKNLEMLFSKETMTRDFPDFEIIKLEEVEVELDEGIFHQGKAKVIRFIGRKKINN